MSDPVLDSEYPSSFELRHPEPDTNYGLPETIEGECVWYEDFDGLIDREQEGSSMIFKSLSLYAGSNKTYKCIVRDRSLNTINVYGGVGVLSLKAKSTDTSFVFQKHTNIPAEGTIGDPTKGELLFYLVPADTSALEERQYVFDVKLTVSGKSYTVAEGSITLHRPINP